MLTNLPSSATWQSGAEVASARPPSPPRSRSVKRSSELLETLIAILQNCDSKSRSWVSAAWRRTITSRHALNTCSFFTRRIRSAGCARTALNLCTLTQRFPQQSPGCCVTVWESRTPRVCHVTQRCVCSRLTVRVICAGGQFFPAAFMLTDSKSESAYNLMFSLLQQVSAHVITASVHVTCTCADRSQSRMPGSRQRLASAVLHAGKLDTSHASPC